MAVPLLDLKAQNDALAPELREAFERVLRSGHFILGPEVETFERALEAFTGSRHVLGVSSGTDAILMALMALGIGPGDEVLCPSFTFFATAGCVARIGATPVFVDSCGDTFNLDLADAERRVTPRTRAIIPVHLFGQAADLEAVQALASRHQLRIIEDAAQAMGASYRGEQVGTFGDFGTVSFFPTKNLGALGDAGALLVQDPALYERARVLRMHGMDPKYHHALVGGNFRLDALQAAFLSVKLRRFDAYTASRSDHAAHYRHAFAPLDGDRLILPRVAPHLVPIWNQFTLRIPEVGGRDALRAFLTARGIGTEIYYPLPLHEQACFAALGYQPEDLPVAHRLAHEVISLPIYPELPPAHLDEVIAAVKNFFGA